MSAATIGRLLRLAHSSGARRSRALARGGGGGGGGGGEGGGFDFEKYLAFLPVAGVDGTLAHR